MEIIGNDIKQISSTLYRCEKCNYETVRKPDYSKHLLTAKHNKEMFGTNIKQKTITLYLCKKCNYETDKKSNYDTHLLTSKHKTAHISHQVFECENCSKIYQTFAGLWKHKKKCRALALILKIIVKIKMPAEDVEGMTLAIFSDMQIDMADRNTNIDDMYTSISKLYAAAGIEVNGIPYKPPHILFWNLRSTNGFPVMTTQKNTSMMSGFSPALLNNFCENGMTSIQSPWDMFMQSLSSKRYDCIQEYMKEYLQTQA